MIASNRFICSSVMRSDWVFGERERKKKQKGRSIVSVRRRKENERQIERDEEFLTSLERFDTWYRRRTNVNHFRTLHSNFIENHHRFTTSPTYDWHGQERENNFFKFSLPIFDRQNESNRSGLLVGRFPNPLSPVHGSWRRTYRWWHKQRFGSNETRRDETMWRIIARSNYAISPLGVTQSLNAEMKTNQTFLWRFFVALARQPKLVSVFLRWSTVGYSTENKWKMMRWHANKEREKRKGKRQDDFFLKGCESILVIHRGNRHHKEKCKDDCER